MAKHLKISEELFNELVDDLGSIISGDYKDDDSQIKTNYYKDSGRPQTSEDFADETGQDSKWYYAYRGYSYNEAVDMRLDEILKEEQQFNQTRIPDSSELSKSYEQPQLESDLNGLASQIANLSQDKEDISAIVLKEILTVIDINSLKPSHKQEILSIINRGGEQ